MTTYVTMIPRKFILESGDTVTLKAIDVEEKLVKDTIFKLWVPDVEAICKYLIEKQGFEHVASTIPKGERYSLRKALGDVWELHLRLYDNGFIDAEVEVRREYLEHLNKRLNVVYEAFEFYRGLYDKLHIFYVSAGEWIVKIIVPRQATRARYFNPLEANSHRHRCGRHTLMCITKTYKRG